MAALEIVAAAERALAESRQAVHRLSRPADEPLEIVIERAAREVAARLGWANLVLGLQPGLRATVATREAFVRIAR